MTRKQITIPLLILGLLVLSYVAFRGEQVPAPSPEALETTTLDFYQVTGITQTELNEYLEQTSRDDGLNQLPVLMLLLDSYGHALADGRVTVRWDDGEYRLLVGKSGVLRFVIDSTNLPGLQLVVPKGYETIRQQTIPLGTVYQPEKELDIADWGLPIVYDGEITANLATQLHRFRQAGKSIGHDEFQRQLERRTIENPLNLPPTEAGNPLLTPAEIYQLRKDAVVVVGQLTEQGGLNTAGGVVIDENGLIATAYHVLNKPPGIVARGVRTTDGMVYAIEEVLVAKQAGDLAVLRIDASGLNAAPLSVGSPVGTSVTMISHPGARFMSLTQGHISRYSAIVLFGRPTVSMQVTADFADGASGGPIFNDRGEICGLVSSTMALSDQMVLRSAVPSRLILNSLQHPIFDEPKPSN